MPLFHVYAVNMCLHLAAYCRGALVILPRYRPELAIAALAAERITAFAGGPTVFTGMLAHPDFAAARFPSLRVSYSGSAPPPREGPGRRGGAKRGPFPAGYRPPQGGAGLGVKPPGGLG